MHSKMHPLFVDIMTLAELISETFGKNCETVLFDMTNGKNSIIYIANGHITDRKIGDSMCQHELSSLACIDEYNRVINHSSITKDGRIIKSSLYFIKDENEKAIGCFCINFDISDLMLASNVLESFLTVEKCKDNSSKDNIDDILVDIVNRTLEQTGSPISYLNKEDKVNIVKILNDKGVFLVKGSVDYVAERLCVSRYTIYNYLEQIKLENE
jgi:predicted transcriptional regulator YheO